MFPMCENKWPTSIDPLFFKIANCWKPFWIKTSVFSLGKVVDFPTHVFTVTSIYRAILTACCLFHQDSYFDFTGKSLAMIAVGGRHSEQSLWLWFMFHGYDMVCQPISVRTQYWHRNIDKMWCITACIWLDKKNVNKITRKVTAVAGWKGEGTWT